MVIARLRRSSPRLLIAFSAHVLAWWSCSLMGRSEAFMIAGRFLLHGLLLTLLLSGCVRTGRFPNGWSDRLRERGAMAMGWSVVAVGSWSQVSALLPSGGGRRS